jgi:hypothetical protein
MCYSNIVINFIFSTPFNNIDRDIGVIFILLITIIEQVSFMCREDCMYYKPICKKNNKICRNFNGSIKAKLQISECRKHCEKIRSNEA